MVDFSRFSSGLNRPARLASWGVAIGIAFYIAKQKQQKETGPEFTQAADWNKKVLEKAPPKPSS